MYENIEIYPNRSKNDSYQWVFFLQWSSRYLWYSARNCSKLPCSAESPAQGEAGVGRI